MIKVDIKIKDDKYLKIGGVLSSFNALASWVLKASVSLFLCGKTSFSLDSFVFWGRSVSLDSFAKKKQHQIVQKKKGKLS
jgi:hypothetical protein